MSQPNYIDELLQATPQANGLLFHALKDGNSAYHIGVAFRLRAECSEQTLREVWDRIQRSQPALRSVFAWQGLRVPHQVIYALPRVALGYERVDLPAGDAAVGQGCLDWLARSKATPFALDAEVFRIACFHDPETGTLDMAFSFHHILMDGWSSSLLISLWVQGLRGQNATVLEARQYSQQLWQGLDPQSLQDSREYWEGVFQALPDEASSAASKLLAENLFRRADGAKDSEPAPAAKAGSRWGRERKAAVEALCRRAGVTPASFFYLCWALTLAKFTFQKSVAFGCAFSGREAALAHDVDRQPLGLFTNTVPLVLTLDGAWDVDAALLAVFRTLQRTQKHEKTPPLTVREAAGLRGDLYDSLVVFDNYPIDAGLQDAAHGAHLATLHSEETTHFGLTLTVSGLEDWRVELGAGETYKGDPEAVHKAFQAFEALAADLVALPAASPIETLTLKFGAADAGSTSLVKGPVNPQVADINAVLAAMLQRLLASPEAVELVDGDRRVGNRELLGGVAALQARLRGAGFVAGDRVAVHLDKGLASAQAILAVLFSGGSYVYLNPKDPTQRKKTLLTLAGCGIVLGGAALRAELGADADRYLLLDVAADADAASVPTLWRNRRPADEFYFIFTSGTTGTPKGISIRNESVANLLDWFVREAGLTAADRVLGLTDLNFDPSVEDLFGSLAVGATLIYPAPRVLQERQAFIDLLRDESVTLVNFIPGAIAQLIEGAPFLPAMRLWIFGGEELPRRLRDELLGQGYAVSNHYGPSETTVDCLSARQSPERDIAIGWPIQNAVAYCADVFGQPLPAGVRGELWVGGDPVASGYATNPIESSKYFVKTNEGVFYRTGDSVTFYDNLGFKYLGRIDDQAKVNGVRIEPRELERVVEALAEIKACCLLPAQSGDGKRQWQLFVDSAEPSEALLPKIREQIRRHLPETWMPARILAVDGFVRTLTGKIDRKPLLERAARQIQAPAGQGVAADPLEARVQAVWSAVLESPAMATDINFFDAGGNSLKIISLQSQLQQAFEREIGVALLFEHPTIASFADWIRRGDAPADPAASQVQPSQAQSLSSARSGKNRLADRRNKAKESQLHES